MAKECLIINVKNSCLYFEYKAIKREKPFVNKNSLFDDCLYYTFKYFKKNSVKVIDSIKKYYDIEKIDTLVLKNIIKFKYVKYIMEDLNLTKLNLVFLKTLSLEDFDQLLDIKTLKSLDIYFVPNFIKKKFEGKNIQIYTRNNQKISDKFMLSLDCFDYDTLYYVKNLKITEYYDSLFDDIREFFRVNYYLKAIHVRYFSKELIEKIIEFINNDESQNVVIFLYQSNDKIDFINSNFSWLKKLNKKCKEKEICEFRIIYSDNFVSKNLFKQLTFNNLKLVSILGIYVCLVMFIISKSYAYVEKLNIDKLNLELMGQLNNYVEDDDSVDIEHPDNEPLEDEDVESSEDLTEEEVNNRYVFNQTLEVLKKMNEDTVAFLKVKNTKISYPVVQTDDNSYYLKKDFYKKKASMGWIYMDYRNNSKELNDNTIIYGHSMLNGTMFGTLKKVLDATWRKNEENMIIELETNSGLKKFKIFSAYKVDYTTDYLKVDFDSKNSFDSFIKLIKGRSVFKSSVNISYGDKILTLSTCTGNNDRRLVVHAVFTNEEE